MVSTSLGLVVDFLVTYTELTPEDIVLDDVIAANPNFIGFPKFKTLVLTVRDVLESCGNVDTDEDVQDALCRAAEEISKLDIGCAPGYTPGEGEGECEVPIADAGGPYSDTVCPVPVTENKGILPIALIDLVGSGTGTGTLYYAWDLDNDSQFDDSTEQNPQDVAFGVGVHIVTLQVTDVCGNTTDEATVTIMESAGVTANAGPDQSEVVCPGADALINLVGSGTGTGLSYAWDLDGDCLFDNSTEQDPQDVPFGSTGSPHTVSLQVTGDCGSVIDEMIVTITECINHEPVIANIPSPQYVINGHTFTYDINATDPDGGDTLTYTLTVNPLGMNIDSITGIITWSQAYCPDRCWTCPVGVTVKVTDDGCCGTKYSTKSFTVIVRES